MNQSHWVIKLLRFKAQMNELLGRYEHFMAGNTGVTVADKVVNRSLTDVSERGGWSNCLNWKEYVGPIERCS